MFVVELTVQRTRTADAIHHHTLSLYNHLNTLLKVTSLYKYTYYAMKYVYVNLTAWYTPSTRTHASHHVQPYFQSHHFQSLITCSI